MKLGANTFDEADKINIEILVTLLLVILYGTYINETKLIEK